jgi:hypothetical protein
MSIQTLVTKYFIQNFENGGNVASGITRMPYKKNEAIEGGPRNCLYSTFAELVSFKGKMCRGW